MLATNGRGGQLSWMGANRNKVERKTNLTKLISHAVYNDESSPFDKAHICSAIELEAIFLLFCFLFLFKLCNGGYFIGTHIHILIHSWIEYWYRKQRQYVCRAQRWSEDVFSAPMHANTLHSQLHEQTGCNIDENRFENELREVTCSNKNSERLIEVMTFHQQFFFFNDTTIFRMFAFLLYTISLSLSICFLPTSVRICIYVT